MPQRYQYQVRLLLEVLPFLTDHSCFALKGGTAINLFYREMPRYSVDIDLCYLPLGDRTTTLRSMHAALGKLKADLQDRLKLKVQSSHALDGKRECKLVASNDKASIKIEPNYVLRGHLFDVVERTLCKTAKEAFEIDLTTTCLQLADLYGGKICAALDRQHPRDLFDIKWLLENEGITENIKHSFIYHLLSTNRPVHELLKPNKKPLAKVFSQEFADMTSVPISLDELTDVRQVLFEKVGTLLSEKDRDFILGFCAGEPNWSLYPYPKIKDFPAIRWKLHNQDKMTANKRKLLLEELQSCLSA